MQHESINFPVDDYITFLPVIRLHVHVRMYVVQLHVRYTEPIDWVTLNDCILV